MRLHLRNVPRWCFSSAAVFPCVLRLLVLYVLIIFLHAPLRVTDRQYKDIMAANDRRRECRLGHARDVESRMEEIWSAHRA